MKDPRVRRDGRCVVCREPRRIPATRYATRQQFETDPFCSRECAEKWHGVKQSSGMAAA